MFARLRKQSDYYNRGQRSAVDLLRDARVSVSPRRRAARMGRMRMSPTDIADVAPRPIPYLMGRRPPPTGPAFAPGERECGCDSSTAQR